MVLVRFSFICLLIHFPRCFDIALFVCLIVYLFRSWFQTSQTSQFIYFPLQCGVLFSVIVTGYLILESTGLRLTLD